MRRLTSRAFIWAVHRWLGLAGGIFILVFSVTGGLLVIIDDLEVVCFPSRYAIAPPENGSHLSAAAQARALMSGRDDWRLLSISPALATNRATRAALVDSSGREWTATLDPYRGAVVDVFPSNTTFHHLLLRLHYTFFLGNWGELLALLAGVVMTGACLTGLWIYRRPLMGVFRSPFLGPNMRARLGSLHRWTGTVSLVMNLVFGLTGIWFMVDIVPASFAESGSRVQAIQEMKRGPIDLAALDTVTRRLAEVYPDGEVLYYAVSDDAVAPIVTRILHRHALVWHKRSRATFDAAGEVVSIQDVRGIPLGEKLSFMRGSLHFGTHGAGWVKWLYCITGFSGAILVASGLWIWWLRQRPKRRQTIRTD